MNALRRAVSTRVRRVLAAAMVLLGVLAAVATSAGSPADRTLAGVAAPVQSAMSVLVAFLGVLLASDLVPSRSLPHAPTLAAAALVGLATATVGAVLCVLTVAVAPAPDHPWAHTPLVLLGSLLVQVNATLVGVGLGLLIRPPVAGEIATIVLPLGLFGFFGAVPGLHGAQQWLTPFATVQHLLSGEMTGRAWAQWAVVVLVWVVGLNVAGAARRRRASAT